MAWIATVAEIVLALALLVGWQTRTAAFLSGSRQALSGGGAFGIFWRSASLASKTPRRRSGLGHRRRLGVGQTRSPDPRVGDDRSEGETEQLQPARKTDRQ